MTTRSGSARYEGFGKEGVGHVSTQSGALDNQPYGFNSRFEEGPGTNPEELIAVAHASCFTMALSFALARAGFTTGTLATTAKVTLDKDDSGFTITRSDLDPDGDDRRDRARAVRCDCGGRQGELPGLESAERRDYADAPAQQLRAAAPLPRPPTGYPEWVVGWGSGPVPTRRSKKLLDNAAADEEADRADDDQDDVQIAA